MNGRKDKAVGMTLLQPPRESSAPHPSASLPPLQTTPNPPASLPLAELSVAPQQGVKVPAGQLGHLSAVGGLLCGAGTLDFVWELCGGTGRSVGLDISHADLLWSIRSPSGLDTTQGSAPTPA